MKFPKWTVPLLVLCGLVAGCVPPDVRPKFTDNTLRIEIHAFHWTSRKDDIIEIRRDIKARVDATNGRLEPLLGDDGKPIINWRHDTRGTHPWKLILSQPINAPAKGIGVSIRARVAEMPGDEQINLVCNFFVNGVEDVKNVQAGVGPEIVCMYRTGF